MATELYRVEDLSGDKRLDASNMCFGIVVAEWNNSM